MIDERTHFKDATGVWKARLPPEEASSIAEQLVTVEDLLNHDIETLVDTITHKVILFPSGAVSSPVHIGLSTTREDPSDGSMIAPVHLPRSDWDELDRHLQELALSVGGSVVNAYCDCVGSRKPVWETELRVTPHVGELDMGEAALMICSQLQSKVDELVEAATVNSDELRASTTTELRQRLKRRATMIQAIDKVHRDLGIKLTPAPEAQQMTLAPKALGVDSFRARAADGEPLPTLVQEAREGVIQTIKSFATALESMPATAQQLVTMHEEQLRDVLLFVLNANWRGTANGEVFTNQGKTDISISTHDRRLFMAELKLWKGAQKLRDAVDQLSGYLVARDTAACLILLYKGRNFTEMRRTAEGVLDKHPRIAGRISTAEDEPARFKLRSSVDNGRVIELVMIPVCLAVAG